MYEHDEGLKTMDFQSDGNLTTMNFLFGNFLLKFLSHDLLMMAWNLHEIYFFF